MRSLVPPAIHHSSSRRGDAKLRWVINSRYIPPVQPRTVIPLEGHALSWPQRVYTFGRAEASSLRQFINLHSALIISRRVPPKQLHIAIPMEGHALS